MRVGGGNGSLHCRSREDIARPTDKIVQCDSIASAQRTLGSSGVGSSRSRQPKNLFSPIIGRADYESHRERAARRGKERIRATEARIEAEMAAAEAARGRVEKSEGVRPEGGRGRIEKGVRMIMVVSLLRGAV